MGDSSPPPLKRVRHQHALPGRKPKKQAKNPTIVQSSPSWSSPLHKAVDDGRTPFFYIACQEGHDLCVKILLAAPGINVNHVSDEGNSALLAACGHVMDSLRRVGYGDSTRACSFASCIEEGKQPDPCSYMYYQTSAAVLAIELSNTQVAEMEDCGQMNKNPFGCSAGAAGPVTGETRWCGCWCWALTPDNLPMCTRCHEYGYCCDEDRESNRVCQNKHWKVGGHRTGCAALVTSSSNLETAVRHREAIITNYSFILVI